MAIDLSCSRFMYLSVFILSHGLFWVNPGKLLKNKNPLKSISERKDFESISNQTVKVTRRDGINMISLPVLFNSGRLPLFGFFVSVPTNPPPPPPSPPVSGRHLSRSECRRRFQTRSHRSVIRSLTGGLTWGRQVSRGQTGPMWTPVHWYLPQSRDRRWVEGGGGGRILMEMFVEAAGGRRKRSRQMHTYIYINMCI